MFQIDQTELSNPSSTPGMPAKRYSLPDQTIANSALGVGTRPHSLNPNADLVFQESNNKSMKWSSALTSANIRLPLDVAAKFSTTSCLFLMRLVNDDSKHGTRSEYKYQ
jgi:hypothetical protein